MAIALASTLFALLGRALAIMLAVGGEIEASLPVAFTALFFSLTAGLVVSRMRHPGTETGRPAIGRTPRGEERRAFSYSRRRYAWNLSFVALIAAGLAGYTVAGFWTGGAGGLVRAVVCGVLALGCAWIVVSAARKDPGGVVVTVSGIYHHTPALEQYVPWEAVREVVPEVLPDTWIGCRSR
ncbi:hypothetical protein [Kineosporia mesophila]|uniref:hypothetical protein n=1 Tax=Kineosporia mesophila TaxID=566012 RepID=UPI001E5ADB05|nr:hypothetical protein [Kineosporia mesophila]MCD5353259.1 hypothetical protein [Kineosporia mesophila]